MKIYKAKDYKDMSRKAANIISAQVIMNQTVYWDWQQDLRQSELMISWLNGITREIWISRRLRQ